MNALIVEVLGIGGLLCGLIIWLLPFFIIISDNKTTGREKLAWLMAVIFISWFAWIFYLLLAPIRKP
ncbi:MAG: hypothetical protein CMC18_01560 [Flavobacteriaceae bacterium]|nr:hypothetical protein [Flavobacteriaceae bacterium]